MSLRQQFLLEPTSGQTIKGIGGLLANPLLKDWYVSFYIWSDRADIWLKSSAKDKIHHLGYAS
jgi:hypothetical protein